MAKFTKAAGILPSVCVCYTDSSCDEIDFEVYREHLRYLLRYSIGGLVVGGHAGETECLTMEERLKVIEIAIEEAKGRVPVIGGIVADSAREAVKQGLIQKEHGADGVLFCPPAIIGWDPVGGDDLLLEHVKKFDREVKLPFILFGGPAENGSYKQLPPTFKKLALQCEHVVGWKIVSGYDEESFKQCVNALREAQAQTGREVGALHAGDMRLVECLLSGGDGNLNGGENYCVEDNTAIYDLFKRGKIEEAKAIQARMRPVTDIIKGPPVGRSFAYFHYRYKIAAWMLGHISRPHMRLPQVVPPLEEFQIIYDALIAAGKKPVHKPAEFEPEPWIARHASV